MYEKNFVICVIYNFFSDQKKASTILKLITALKINIVSKIFQF